MYTAVQNQKAVSPYLYSKHMLPFGSAQQYDIMLLLCFLNFLGMRLD